MRVITNDRVFRLCEVKQSDDDNTDIELKPQWDTLREFGFSKKDAQDIAGAFDPKEVRKA
jgi:hypothetical protein